MSDRWLVLLTLLFCLARLWQGGLAEAPPAQLDASVREISPQISNTTVVVLIDDFLPQPLQGESVWYYNRLGGDRGRIDGWWDPTCGCTRPGGGYLEWGVGVITATITQTQGLEAWQGTWSSLNHPIAEGIPLSLGAIFPSQVLPQYQGRITAVRVHVIDGSGTLRLEMQAPDDSLPWWQESPLGGTEQTLQFPVPFTGEIQNLNWLVKGQAGDFVVVERIEMLVEVPELSVGERGFLWSYAMLLDNWDPTSGLTRDRANFPAGDFDNVSASGLQAVAAVLAWHLGFIPRSSAIEVVEGTTTGLMSLPRCHGLWPHFVANGQIAPGTEWSSLDTVITAVALIEAREALGLDTAPVEAVLTGIDWTDLLLPNGQVSHGYDNACSTRLEAGWYDFGTETWLVNYGYAAASGNVAEMDSTPPTFNGSGFIDEMAWLLLPPPSRDRWEIDWGAYRESAVSAQVAYYADHSCYASMGLFGLSAAEVPAPSEVTPSQIYQPFGVGGTVPANDGTSLLGHAVVVPHYPAMVSALRPDEAVTSWERLMEDGLFTPLNNTESLMFDDEPSCTQVRWNGLRGSWNLGLQALGWGRYLSQSRNPLYEAMWANEMLAEAYRVLWAPCCQTFLPVVGRDWAGQAR